MPGDREILDQIRRAFATRQRPEHFTNNLGRELPQALGIWADRGAGD